MLTDRATVVIQGRPVVAATTWLTHVVRNTVRTGRELHIVTPPGTRLTFPARTLLHYALGDGTNPAAWERLRQINDHLSGDRSRRHV